MRSSRPLLILVDGFRIGPPNLLLVRRYYASMGFDARIAPVTLRDLRDIEHYGITLAAYAAHVTGRHGPADLLSFSMGGIAAIDAIKRDGIGSALRCAVSYGTPFHGSPYATLGTPLSPAWRLMSQLRLMSPYLRRLRRLPLPKDLRVVSLAGAWDLICPPPLCRLDGAHNVVVPGGHTSFLYDTALHDRIAREFLAPR